MQRDTRLIEYNLLSLQEHQMLKRNDVPVEYDKKYDKLLLVTWKKSLDDKDYGYFGTYKIGAEWMDDDEALVVTTKKDMENIDFLRMFMTCFSSDLALDKFADIYTIDYDKKPISAPALQGVVSPLIVLHFLGVVSRIKSLKKGYVNHCENLHKVKGHIQMLYNERKNIITKRYDRIMCSYDEYSEDIPENRLLKKALTYAQSVINNINEGYREYAKIRYIMARTMSLFQNVSDDVHINEIKHIKTHKLFKEYAEAVRLAKLILRHTDYSIYKDNKENGDVVPFTLDMSLLFEHYVYGLLFEAYGRSITYQFESVTGKPDFLYKSNDFKVILDTKYIPKYKNQKLDTYVIRQLAGYARDIKILRFLGYKDDEGRCVDEVSKVADVPCVIIYSEEGKDITNPFLNHNLKELCKDTEPNMSRFYKISVSLPTIGI